MQIPVIYKGDDTDFRGNANLAIRLATEIDLSDCRIEFTFLGQKRIFDGSAAGTALQFVFTSAETALFPVGTHKAKVRVFDSEGRVRTMDDSIRIRVTDNLKEAYGWEQQQEIAVDVRQSRTGSMLSGDDVLDCGASFTELKERVAFLWERSGGRVSNREALEY